MSSKEQASELGFMVQIGVVEWIKFEHLVKFHILQMQNTHCKQLHSATVLLQLSEMCIYMNVYINI